MKGRTTILRLQRIKNCPRRPLTPPHKKPATMDGSFRSLLKLKKSSKPNGSTTLLNYFFFGAGFAAGFAAPFGAGFAGAAIFTSLPVKCITTSRKNSQTIFTTFLKVFLHMRESAARR
jgi:hypothetical protein